MAWPSKRWKQGPLSGPKSSSLPHLPPRSPSPNFHPKSRGSVANSRPHLPCRGCRGCELSHLHALSNPPAQPTLLSTHDAKVPPSPRLTDPACHFPLLLLCLSVVRASADLCLTPGLGLLVDWLPAACSPHTHTPTMSSVRTGEGRAASDALWCGPCSAAGLLRHTVLGCRPHLGSCRSASRALVQENGAPQLGLSLRVLSEP